MAKLTVGMRNIWARGRRFYTARDMAMIKHDEAVINSQIKRGDSPPKKTGYEYIAVCGCGAEGCFIHGSVERREP